MVDLFSPLTFAGFAGGPSRLSNQSLLHGYAMLVPNAEFDEIGIEVTGY